MRSTTSSVICLALSVALVAACGATAASLAPAAAPTTAPTIIPAAAVTFTPTAATVEAPSAVPTPTPMPTTDGKGDEVVRGLEVLGGLLAPYQITKVGDVYQYRGGIVSLTDEMNDPRVSGTVTFRFSLDEYTAAAPEWGTMKVDNKDGAWNGTCTGGSWAKGEGISWSCWLTGSGAYDGYTYYKMTRKEATDKFAQVTGVVYPGAIPKP